MAKKAVYDILRLPTKGKFYKPRSVDGGEIGQIDSIRVERLSGYHEDILNSRELMASNKVWETMYNMTVMDKDVLPFHELMFVDIFAFMVHTRKTAYGSTVEQPNTQIMIQTPSGYESVMDTAIFDLEDIKFEEPSDKFMPDENGLFSFKLPTSGKVLKFKVLNDAEDRMAVENANRKKEMMGLKAAPVIRERLEASIISVDGELDRFKISDFLGGSDFMPLDSMEFRKYQNSILPSMEMNLKAVAKSRGVEGKANIQLGFSFFFPAYGI